MEDQNEINNATLEFDYQPTQENHSIIKVVGVGGGGSNAVQHMYEAGIQDVSFLIINTDKQALKGSSIPNKLLISEKGLGAGARPEVARECAVQYSDAIRQALSDGTEMVFITAGMGGGTGTGASPVVAQIAHEMGLLTVGIVTIPFQFEGRKKITAALEGVRAIERWCDALLVVNNNRLISIYPDLTFDNAFGKADDTLTVAAKSISDIINIQGYINLDFADVSTTLRNGGVALISTGQASGEGRLTKAIQESITSPLLQDNKINDAKHLLFELCFSHDNPISMAEIGEMNKFVESLNPEIEVIWGAMYDDNLGDDVRIILLASGFAMDHTTGGVIADSGMERKVREMELELRDAICRTQNRINEFADFPEASNILMSAIRLATNKADNMTLDTDLEEEFTKLTQAVEAARANMQAKIEADEQERLRKEKEEAEKRAIEDQIKQLQEKLKAANAAAAAPKVEEPSLDDAQARFEQRKQREAEAEAAAQTATSAPAAATATTTSTARPQADPLKGIEEIRRFYGDEAANKMLLDNQRKTYYVLDDQELSNEALIERLEQLPAYNRTLEDLGQLKAVSRTPATPKVIGNPANYPDGTIHF